MVIDFRSLEPTVLHNFRGGEKDTIANMFMDGNNKIMVGHLEPGASIGMHKHEKNSEIICILKGNAKILYDDKEEVLEYGTCHYCPMGHSHSLINIGTETLEFFAVVPEHKL